MINNFEGMKFGHLRAIKCLDEKKNGKSLWECRCDCGKSCRVRTDSLTGGKVISCGCVAKGPDKIKMLKDSRKIEDHTSKVFFSGTISKNNTTGINGVSKLKSGKYRASIGYKNKVYSLIEDYNIEIARQARTEAEEAVKNGEFEKWIGEFKNGRKK